MMTAIKNVEYQSGTWIKSGTGSLLPWPDERLTLVFGVTLCVVSWFVRMLLLQNSDGIYYGHICFMHQC